MKAFRALSGALKFKSLEPGKRDFVFYSENKNYWQYLEGLVKGLLDQDDVGVCYISSSQDDPGLALKHKNLTSIEIDAGFVRNWLFQNITEGIVVMTMPDINQYQVKRVVGEKLHYVYVQHALMSLHMAYRPGAFNHYDSIFCSGPHHVKEMRAIQEYYDLPEKNLVEIGYSMLDKLIANKPDDAVVRVELGKDYKKHILCAPSWGQHALIESGKAADAISKLLEANYKVTFRPHPQTRIQNNAKISAIVTQFKNHSLFCYEPNITTQAALYESDILMTDWSGIALEYALGLGKPVIFVDSPRKVNNPDYGALGIEPFEVRVRSDIGVVIPADDVVEAASRVNVLKSKTQNLIFNPGYSDQVGVSELLKIKEDMLL